MTIRWIHNPEQEEDFIISYKDEASKKQKLKNLLDFDEIKLTKNNEEVLLNLNDILFFETGENLLQVHTDSEVYEISEKLYQLEASLPAQFMRISKSCIVNVNQISALEKHLTSGRSIRFYKSHKITYVSRMFFPLLKEALNERSLL